MRNSRRTRGTAAAPPARVPSVRRPALAALLLVLAGSASAEAKERPRSRELTWPATPGAVSYELQVAVDAGFQSVVSRGVTRSTRFPWSASASPVLRYRVRAVRRDGSLSGWSAPRLVATGRVVGQAEAVAAPDEAADPGRDGGRPARRAPPESAPVPPAEAPPPALASATLEVVARLAGAELAPPLLEETGVGGPAPAAAPAASRPATAAVPRGRPPLAPALTAGVAGGWRSPLEGAGSPAVAAHASAWPRFLGGRVGLRLQLDGFALAVAPAPVYEVSAGARFTGLALQAGIACRERAGRVRLEAGALAGGQLGRATVGPSADVGLSAAASVYGALGLALARGELALEVHLTGGAWQSRHAEVPLAGVSALLGWSWGLR